MAWNGGAILYSTFAAKRRLQIDAPELSVSFFLFKLSQSLTLFLPCCHFPHFTGIARLNVSLPLAHY